MARKLKLTQQADKALARQRLLSRLDPTAPRRLTLVTGPPGFGKTTLMRQWRRMCVDAGVGTAWLSLEEDDNDLNAFRLRFRNAISAAEKEAARSGAGFVIIFLDDFHRVANPAVEQMIADITLRSDDTVCFTIGSRTVPLLPLGRLRMLGELEEIRTEDLRFRDDEARLFLKRAARREISDRQAAMLNERTEGWPAALRLAALSLDEDRDPGHFIASFGGRHRDVMDFLMEDVLNRQDDATREFLLRTSVCPRLSGALCDALMNGNDGAQILERLERRNLFLVPLDAERTWYRYHSLFQQFLLATLVSENSCDIAALRRKAAEWYASHDFITDGVRQALDAGDLELAATLLDRGAESLFQEGRLGLVLSLAAQIPEAILSRHPRLQLVRVWALEIRLELDGARQLLSEIRSSLDGKEIGDEAEDRALRMLALHRELILAFATDTVLEAERYLDELAGESASADPYVRATLRNCRNYVERETYEAHRAPIGDPETRALYATPYGSVWLECVAGPSFHALGNLTEAQQSFERGLASALEIDSGVSAISAMPAFLLAEILWEAGDNDGAAVLIDRHRAYFGEMATVDEMIAGYVTASRVAARSGDESGALAVLERARQFGRDRRLARLAAAASGEEVRLRLALGQRDEAIQVARLEGLMSPPEGAPGRRRVTSIDEIRTLAWARVALASGEARDVARVLRPWLRFVEDRGYGRGAVRLGVMQALALQQINDGLGAQRALRTALRWGAPGPFVASFAQEGPAMAVLLKQRALGPETNPSMAAYRRRLLDRIEPKLPEAMRAETLGGAAEGLSPREADILGLVAHGLVNRDIAAELGVSVATVKYHLQQIFQKLNVHRKSEALARARALGFMR